MHTHSSEMRHTLMPSTDSADEREESVTLNIGHWKISK